jgi:methionine-rich copper-binding protein CopC
VALTIAQGGAASAHANFFRSVPAPNERLAQAPRQVVIGFSEALDPKQSGIDVMSPDGRTVATGAEATADPTELRLALPVLATSTYVAAWHTVSAVDGDAAHGYFGFAVGPDTPGTGVATLTADTSQTHATFEIAPGRVGTNAYRARVTDASGNALANVTRVRVLVMNLDRDIGTSVIVLPAAGGEYAAIGMDLGLEGRYALQLEVRRKDVLDDLIYRMSFTASRTVATATPGASSTPTAVTATSTDGARRDEPATGWLWLAAAGVVLVAGVAVWATRRR